MIAKDRRFSIARSVLKDPIRHFYRFVVSFFKKKPYLRDGDFFLYGIPTADSLKKLLEDPDALFVVGFSYCEKTS